MNAKRIIKRLGGPSEVARIFGISRQAVSQWKWKGIPKDRADKLKIILPELFK